MSHVEASVLFFCEASHHKAPQLRWKKTTGGVHGITRCKAGAGLPRWKALSLNAAPAWISHCVCTLGIHNESKQGHGKSKEAKLTMVCYSPQSLAEACASHLGHPRSIALIWFSQQADSTRGGAGYRRSHTSGQRRISTPLPRRNSACGAWSEALCCELSSAAAS